MALISCPECENQISEFSTNCPNCGYPINPLSNNVIVKKNEGCFLQTLNIGCLIFAIIGIMIFVLSIVMTGTLFFKTNKEPIKTETKKDGN